MPLRHCTKCHHEWETKHETCYWRGADSRVLVEVTPFERWVKDFVENRQWLELAEPSFAFWDNEQDAKYDEMRVE